MNPFFIQKEETKYFNSTIFQSKPFLTNLSWSRICHFSFHKTLVAWF